MTKENRYELGIDLSEYFLPVKKIFRRYRHNVADKRDNEKHRVFVNNGSKVLFVAHLDTVHRPKYIGYENHKQHGEIVKAVGLDDRLGWYVIDKLVNRHGLKADILLTDHEEIGNSTAHAHKLKKYNWVAEFDRRGDDYVCYSMTSPKFNDALKKHFTKSGFGSYSDICAFKKFHKICAVNVGIGYERAHFEDSYVSIDTHNAQINRFISFFEENYNTRFNREFIPSPVTNWNQNRYGRSNDNYGYGWQRQESKVYQPLLFKQPKSPDIICTFCGMAGGQLCHDVTICQDCLGYAIEASSLDAMNYNYRISY